MLTQTHQQYLPNNLISTNNFIFSKKILRKIGHGPNQALQNRSLHIRRLLHLHTADYDSDSANAVHADQPVAL